MSNVRKEKVHEHGKMHNGSSQCWSQDLYHRSPGPYLWEVHVKKDVWHCGLPY